MLRREDTADNLDSLKQTAFAERAEMKSSGLQRKIAQDQAKYTKGAYWPTLSIGGKSETGRKGHKEG